MADNFTKQQFRFHMGFISIFRKSLLITTSWMFNQRRAFFAKCTLKTFFAKCTLKCLPFFMNWCHVFLHVSIRRKAFITHLHLSFPSWTDVTFYSLMDWCYMFLHISSIIANSIIWGIFSTRGAVSGIHKFRNCSFRNP